jgi:VanZ family protein
MSAFQIAAWLSLFGLLVVTLSPIGWRPVSGLPIDAERFLALLVLGVLFGAAYPLKPLLVASAIAAGLAILEMAQALSPSRHARLSDFLFKALGSTVGVGLGVFLAARLGL